MSSVLFLSIPSHGNVNPTLGLVSELIKRGEEIIYFSSDTFRERIEATGAIFRNYAEDLDIFKAESKPNGDEGQDPFMSVIRSAEKIIDDILHQTSEYTFDYMIHSAAFPFTKVIAQLLKIPTISSLAIFAGLKEFFSENDQSEQDVFPQMEEMMKTYKDVSRVISEKYSVQMPDNIFDLLLNKGDLNFVYTSDYFISPADKDFFDDTYKFVGPPIYERKENLDFPFEKLQGKKVIYISLGTVFSSFNLALYDIFFKSFADWDAVIVLAAYHVDLSRFSIPDNFIVRNYVPQSEILTYTDVAITHAGMNSISDLVYRTIPFVSIPLGADQPALAKRAEELGATISLDAENLTPELLSHAVDKVLSDPSYLQNIQKINKSFKEAGGYKKAVDEIAKLKSEKAIYN